MGVEGSLLLLVALSLLLMQLLLRRCRPARAGAGAPLLMRLPPSPRLAALPVLGHLHLVWRVLRNPTTALKGLSQNLGPVFTLRLGSTPLIFVTSAPLLREALLSGEAEAGSVFFSSRPHLPSRALFTHNFRSINSAPYGPLWRSLRRNLAHNMLAPPSLLSFQPARSQSLHFLLVRLHSQALLNKGLVSFLPACRLALIHLAFFMCFGFHTSDDDLQTLSALLDCIVSFSVSEMRDFFPFIRFLQRNKIRRVLALREKQIHLFTYYIEKHQQLQKLGQLTVPGTYLETLLHKDTHLPPLSNMDLVTLCAEFLVAGSDTIMTSLQWTMAHLVNDPVIQSRLYKHIHDVVGDIRPNIEENDLPHIPYLQAVIRESLRLCPPTHFALPHAVSAPAKLATYDIPTDAIIYFHISSTSRDPSVWEEPLQFRPERFLGVDVDMTGTKEITMLPFSAGRRACPGQALALMEMELFVGGLVHAFHWSTASSPGRMLDLSETTGATVLMKHPLRARIRARSADWPA